MTVLLGAKRLERWRPVTAPRRRRPVECKTAHEARFGAEKARARSRYLNSMRYSTPPARRASRWVRTAAMWGSRGQADSSWLIHWGPKWRTMRPTAESSHGS